MANIETIADEYNTLIKKLAELEQQQADMPVKSVVLQRRIEDMRMDVEFLIDEFKGYA